MYLRSVLIIFLLTSTQASFSKETYEYAIDLYGATDVRTAARDWMLKRNKPDVVPALIRSLRYYPEDASQTLHVLKALTGQELGKRWFDWFVWLNANPIESFPKNELYIKAIFNRLDPAFKVFFYPDIERHIHLGEITWGGVRKDGIPALTNPKLIDAEQADYLTDKELVFGISINGDTRAYPQSIMDWHEMFNDVIGGVPVSLAYCTLCNAGILYKTKLENRKSPFIFGSSGFLYRSNKLMYDQETHTLWNQFSGKPVVGPLTNSGIELEVLPVVMTSWKEWKTQHPNTKVLDINTGFDRDYAPWTAYGSYYISDELMFPAHVGDNRLHPKERVFGLRVSGAHKAWPLSSFSPPKAINDHVGIVPIVIIGNVETHTVRAYRSEGKQFALDKNGELMENGQVWTINENELTGPNNESLKRLPGHIAYWFAWSGYFPESLSE